MIQPRASGRGERTALGLARAPLFAMPDQPPRRRFQFRLRTLMVGVTLLAVPCSYVGWQVRVVKERRLQIEARSSPWITLYRGKEPLTNGPNWFRRALAVC
jgi:hypothetical protein